MSFFTPSLKEKTLHKHKLSPPFLVRNHSFDSFEALRNSAGDSLDSYFSRYEEDFIELEKLASGGFGTVFRVKNRLDGRTYAIKKVFFKNNKNNQLNKTLREVKALAKLTHPNIVRYYQAWIEHCDYFHKKKHKEENSQGTFEPETSEEETIKYSSFHPQFELSEEDSIIFTYDEDENTKENKSIDQNKSPTSPWDDIKMEVNRLLKNFDRKVLYIQMQLCSDNLQNWLEQRREISTAQNIDIFKQICEGLRYIHSQNIIHRDLKPANIFLQKNNDGSFIVFLGDFGLATETNVDEDIESSGSESDSESDIAPKSIIHTSGIGTQTYSSPEQINNENYNEKVDVYSLGIIFFELFYHFTTKMERINVLSKLRKGIFPKGFQKTYPKESKFISWLLSNNPVDRPSADQILEHELFQSESVTIPRSELQRLEEEIKMQKIILEQQRQQIELLSRIQNTN